jgi:carbon storage regulator
MLVLSRKVGERIMVGDNIAVVINRIAGNRVTIGIEAPENVAILRGELENVKNEFKPEQEREQRPRVAPTGAAQGSGYVRDFEAPLLAFRSVR